MQMPLRHPFDSPFWLKNESQTHFIALGCKTTSRRYCTTGETMGADARGKRRVSSIENYDRP